MLFTTDQQTIDDLNIFGKASANSVYGIFNKTLTRGGAVLLEEMFRFPLSDAGAINKRSSIIQYFSKGAVFPFNSELFDVIEEYLLNQDERTKISEEGDQLGKKLSNLILDDNNYKFVYKGVTALIAVLKSCRDFIGNLQPSPYQTEAENILNILDDQLFAAMMKEVPESKMSYTKLGSYDQVLRFSQRAKIKSLLHYIYQLDVYVSVGSVAAGRGFVFAAAQSENNCLLRLEGVYHPGLQHAIANSFELNQDRNLVFLTGANMAGKSTFMKSLGIAMYLGHMGFPVAATVMEFSVTDGIYTTINLPDNLGMGSSHFYAEVLRVKKLTRELQLGKKLFVIIDELFRGTNVKDAYEATIAITAMFAARRKSMFIISSHIIEAGEVLKERCENIGFHYLPTRMEGNKPVYSHLLTTGITSDRHGMVIINNEGILDILRKGRRKEK
jgi:DNA mismatch repair protein MutS